MAKDALKEIYAKGKIPLIVGGTGFYIQSLLYDIDFTKEDGDQEYRKQLEEKAKREGNDSLYEMLKQVDPKSTEKIHKNNVKRVIRALEFYKLNGYPTQSIMRRKQQRPHHIIRLFCIKPQKRYLI